MPNLTKKNSNVSETADKFFFSKQKLFFVMFISLIIGTIILILVCLTGDKICGLSVLQNGGRYGHILRALADNLTHGIVGGISWWLLVGFVQPKTSFFQPSRLNQAVLCICLSSFIDIDHFLAAGSIHIEDITKLPHRPPLHCSGLCLVASVIVWAMSRYYPGMVLLPWEWLLSFLSHHVRDATRRGLWIVPKLITTRPLPYYLYLTLVALIPPLIGALMPSSLLTTTGQTFIV